MRWRSGWVLMSAAAVAFAVGCRQKMQSSVDPAGPQAARIEHLFWAIFWLTLIVTIIVLAVLTTGVFKSRVPGRAQPEPILETPEEDRRATRVVVASVVITVVILFVLLAVSVSTGRTVAHVDTNSPVSIQVTGHQWWWEITYQSSNPNETVTTANEIHVPVGVPVVINTASRDVIHSFWAPNLQGKRDLIPGYTTAIWFQADREGTFRGQCAEFCGLQHAHMGFLIIAEPKDKFEHWMAQQRKAAEPPMDDLAKRGQQIFMSGPCVMCHTIRGTMAGSRVGPDLTHLASRSTIAAATLPNTRGNLGGWIIDSQRIKPGNRMPQNQFSGDDLQALISYLETLK